MSAASDPEWDVAHARMLSAMRRLDDSLASAAAFMQCVEDQRAGRLAPKVVVPADPRCEALETAGGVLIGLGSCLALLAIGAFWVLLFVAVARVALG